MSSKTPRNFETDHYTPYESVELGYPSEADELIYEYAEGDDYTNTVYGYVPVDIVEKLIEKHGGYKGVVVIKVSIEAIREEKPNDTMPKCV